MADRREAKIPVSPPLECFKALSVGESATAAVNDSTSSNVEHPLFSSWTVWYDSPQTKVQTDRTASISPTASEVPRPTSLVPSAQSWMSDIKKVGSFASVEDFWALYKIIVPPSQLPMKASYYLFKENIFPAWEDEANKLGGKWSIQLPRNNNRNAIDKMWLNTMLAATGETFEPTSVQSATVRQTTTGTSELTEAAPPSSLITGVIVSIRAQFFRISVCTRLDHSSLSPAPDGNGWTLTPTGLIPTLLPHPSEEVNALEDRIGVIGKYFKTAVLGFPEDQKFKGGLATGVEYVSHKDSKTKGVKKWVI